MNWYTYETEYFKDLDDPNTIYNIDIVIYTDSLTISEIDALINELEIVVDYEDSFHFNRLTMDYDFICDDDGTEYLDSNRIKFYGDISGDGYRMLDILKYDIDIDRWEYPF